MLSRSICSSKIALIKIPSPRPKVTRPRYSRFSKVPNVGYSRKTMPYNIIAPMMEAARIKRLIIVFVMIVIIHQKVEIVNIKR